MKELDKKVVDLYQEMGKAQGIQDQLLMELFARIYLEPEPIAMEELAKRTGYSLASVSNKVKILSPLMHIKKIKKPGSKKVYLYMEKDIMNMWKEAMINKEEYVVKKVKEKMPEIIQEYSQKAKTEKDKKKVIILEQYYDQMLQFEKILKKMIKEFDSIN